MQQNFHHTEDLAKEIDRHQIEHHCLNEIVDRVRIIPNLKEPEAVKTSCKTGCDVGARTVHIVPAFGLVAGVRCNVS